jgi:hypothetical protein
MQIEIFSTPNASVTINGINVASVKAAIQINENEDATELVITLFPFENNKPVQSNMSEILTTVPNDTETEPDMLITIANDAMYNYLISLGYEIAL